MSSPTKRAVHSLIGAHALTAADRLLTRNRGFYRAHFTDLEILDPSQDPHEQPAS